MKTSVTSFHLPGLSALPIWNGVRRIQNLVTARTAFMREMSDWSRLAQRRAARVAPKVKWAFLVALIGSVGLVEFALRGAVTTSLFYVLLVGLAVWLIDTPAGFAAAALCSVVASGANRTIYAPIGEASVVINVLLCFAVLSGVVLGASLLRAVELRLLHEVTVRTRRLRLESSRRHRLEAEILELASGEQQYLAQQIHDELGQYISALTYHAKMLAEDLHEMSSAHAGQADRIADLIRTTNEAIRRLGRGGQTGEFVDALQGLSADLERLTGVTCVLRSTVGPLALGAFQSMMLFRIVQEACANAVKHGNPRTIAILLSMRGSTLCVEVDDDGCGFASGSTGHSGIGLQMMRRRANMIGATLRIRSAIVGCTLTCEVPVAESWAGTP